MKRFVAASFEKIPNLVHGFGIASFTAEDYLQSFKLRDAFIPTTRQVHGDVVHVIDGNYGGEYLEGDAFVTAAPRSVCVVRTADCVPLLVVDSKRRVIGAIHAGWRGAAGRIVTKTLQRMADLFSSSVDDLHIAIGPALCGDCYEVGDDVIAQFSAREKAVAKKQGRWHLDLVTALEIELTGVGVQRESVEALRICTKCSGEPLASYRSGLSPDDRQVNFIAYR